MTTPVGTVTILLDCYGQLAGARDEPSGRVWKVVALEIRARVGDVTVADMTRYVEPLAVKRTWFLRREYVARVRECVCVKGFEVANG